MKYEQIRDKLNTGDVILFRGRGIVSVAIRWWCSLFGRRWTWASHVGTVMRRGDDVLILESTSLKGGFKGVRLDFLSDVIAEYAGTVRIRLLDMERNDEFMEDGLEFASRKIGRPYQRGVRELTRSAWTIDRNKTATPESLFCSELVAMLYQRWRLLPESPTANNYTPEDFRPGRKVDKAIAASGRNARLAGEIEIERT